MDGVSTNLPGANLDRKHLAEMVTPNPIAVCKQTPPTAPRTKKPAYAGFVFLIPGT